MTSAVERLRRGGVIPAHPLVLNDRRRPDWDSQRALTRYYMDAGVSGIAVGVHTTQFEIREHPGLFERVLEEASAVASERDDPPVMIAGAAGGTKQAVMEAELAREHGYDFILLAPYGAEGASEDDLIERTRAVGEVLPVIAFYLQPSVGGRILGTEYWQRTADLDCVAGVKAAPFNRYHTLALLRGVARSKRGPQIALFTGNDDHIIADLTSVFHLPGPDGAPVELRFVGGLLGQWAVWTKGAVRIMRLADAAREGDSGARDRLNSMAADLTDANRAIFDASNEFAGCVPGVHEVLRRQGLMPNTFCLDSNEVLSPGQQEAIAEVWDLYPWLRD